MKAFAIFYLKRSGRHWILYRIVPIAVFLSFILMLTGCGAGADLKVMKMGVGSGTIESMPAGINCGSTCDATFSSPVDVTLTATADPNFRFVEWQGDCTGSGSCTVHMDSARSVRAVFDLDPPIPLLSDAIPGTSFGASTDFTPERIRAYLDANPSVNTPARFLKALPVEYKRNWLLMSRSESLQTGLAALPRILLPSANAQFVFSIGLDRNNAYPGADPLAIEFMQWDPAQKNFRFHEIVLDAIPPLNPDGIGTGMPARFRGIAIDDTKCSKCHSTRNVLNLSPYPGTTGIPVGSVQAKGKPNWDAYDSWAGMLPFNRDRIYQGSVEAAAFRKIFNPWTWRTNPAVGSVIEQLELQPPGIPAKDAITRMSGGLWDGHVSFDFDPDPPSPPVLVEPAPAGSAPTISTNYTFNGLTAGTASPVIRGGAFVTLHHSGTPTLEEGRAVQFFDLLGGQDGHFNARRIADELVNHRFATGSVPFDVRPIALAITNSCIRVDNISSVDASALAFFDSRNGMTLNAVVSDTLSRQQSLPRRKADIQKINLDRTGDIYLSTATPENGLVQHYGANTAAGTTNDLSRLRQEVFRRPIDAGLGDATVVMGGNYVDREEYGNTSKIALYRYFLEPLGVSVDKWSMGARGRSRTYTFADVFNSTGNYRDALQAELTASLTSRVFPGLTNPGDCTQLISAVNTSFGSLPPANAMPTYTDVQRILNKSCIECHGGLEYPPYPTGSLDVSEEENPTGPATAAPNPRLNRSYTKVLMRTNGNPTTSSLYQKITATSENCPGGLMPCGGPPLSRTDIETIRRWIIGPPAQAADVGDPHITTVDGIHYDFQAAGEFTLLRDEGMVIQARQTAVQSQTALGPNPYTGLTSCVSVNSAVAVQIGTERITYQPDPDVEQNSQGMQLRVNGELVQLGADGIPLDNGGRIISSTAPGGIQIEAPGGGTAVIITPNWWDYYQLWYLNIDTRHMRATQGIMGAIAPGSWLPALPDGNNAGPMPADLQQRYKVLYDLFGDAWRVSDTTSLFDYAPGTSTSTFTMQSWPNGESPQSCLFPLETGGVLSKLPLPPLAPEAAQQACQAIIDPVRRANCIQDVTVTGEAGFAEAYLQSQQILLNADPAIPELVSPADNGEPGRSVKFTWNRVSDEDGDAIQYKHCIWSINEDPNNNDCEPVPSETTEPGKRTGISLLIALAGCILLILLVARRIQKRRALLFIVAIAIIAAAFLVYRLDLTGSDTTTVSQTARGLESGQTYYWKVIAEDGKGAMVESATRRILIR